MPVQVFDKSRDIGGRLAARRRGGGLWHHGAAEVQARAPEFRRFLAEQTRNRRAVIVDQNDDCLIARGATDMRELTRSLAAGLEMHFDVEVVTLTRSAKGWMIADTNGRVFGPFDAVLSAIPAPQVTALLERSGLTVPQELASVRMIPRWSFLVGFQSPPPQWVPDDENVAGLVTMTPRPRSELPYCFVLQASDAWSFQHLECARDEAAELMSRYLEVNSDSRNWLARASQIKGHRWRYALTSRPLGHPFLYEAATGLGHTGDWCTGATAEAAYLNGLLLADEVSQIAAAPSSHGRLDRA